MQEGEVGQPDTRVKKLTHSDNDKASATTMEKKMALKIKTLEGDKATTAVTKAVIISSTKKNARGL